MRFGSLTPIRFTSGTTGIPKGVMIEHRNYLCGIIGSQHVIEAGCTKDETFPAYLPLAHVFELLAELQCCAAHTKIGYAVFILRLLHLTATEYSNPHRFLCLSL